MENLRKHTDQPITSVEDDYLGHAEYAKKIATMYSEWNDDKSSLVTALYGEWGSGKTSLKNLIIRALREGEGNKEDVLIVEYNPWEWESQDSIVESFYNTLIGQLDKQGENAKKIAFLLRKIQSGLTNTNKALEFLTSHTATIISFLLVIFGVIGFKVENINSYLASFFTFSGLVLLGVDRLIALYLYFLPDKKQSPQQLKEELAKVLSDRKKPLIIVLDDLDRLSPEQVRTVIQLVKVNMNFPNTVFMLLYQQDIVEKMLTNDYQNGSEYMKKIIQLPLSMPQDSVGNIRGLLAKALHPYLGKSERNNLFRVEISDYIFSYFKTVRDVKRFLISFKFNYGALKGDNDELYLDPLDFFILETLRIYDQKLFHIISMNKNYLIELFWNKFDSVSKIILDKFTDHEEKEVNKKILDFLFTKESNGQDQSTVNRIYNKDVFEKYFSLTQYNLPSLNISKIIDSTEEELMSLYNTWHNIGRDRDFLEYLYRNIDSLDREKTDEYLRFLLKVSDQLTRNDYALFSAFNKLFRKLEEEQRGEFFLSKINIKEEQYGYLLISYSLSLQTNDKEKYFSIEDFGSIKNKYCEKIIGSLSKKTSSIFYNQYLYHLLIHLRLIYPHKLDMIKDFITRFIRDDIGNILIFLDKFVRNYSTSGPEFSGVKYYISKKNIQDFISLEVIDSAIERLDQSLLDESHKKLIEMYYEDHDGFP